MLAFERTWAVAILEGFAPSDGPGLAPAAGEVDYLRAIQKMMHASTGVAAFGLRMAVWIAALAPMWLLGRATTIRSLAPARRAELLGRLLAHRFFLVRELTLLLKLGACMAIFARPALRERSGYDRHEGLDYDSVGESGERPKAKVKLSIWDDGVRAEGAGGPRTKITEVA